VKEFGLALCAVAGELRINRKFVLEAVKEYGSVLKYASEALRCDRDVVLEAGKMCAVLPLVWWYTPVRL